MDFQLLLIEDVEDNSEDNTPNGEQECVYSASNGVASRTPTRDPDYGDEAPMQVTEVSTEAMRNEDTNCTHEEPLNPESKEPRRWDKRRAKSEDLEGEHSLEFPQLKRRRNTALLCIVAGYH